MTRITEQYYCDICGKEYPTKQIGHIDLNNGVGYPCTRFVNCKEVCIDCCNKLLDLIKEIESEKIDIDTT